MCWEEHTAATCAPTLCSLRALPETTCGSVLCRPSLGGVGLAGLHALPERRVWAQGLGQMRAQQSR